MATFFQLQLLQPPVFAFLLLDVFANDSFNLAGGDWPARARHAATALSGSVSLDDDTVSIRLLADVRQVFTEETIASPDLVHRLVGLEDRPWADGAGGRPITQARVARLLRPFGIHPLKLRFGDKTANGYTKRMFDDPWSRYLPRNSDGCTLDT